MVAPPGNQAANGENKPQPVASGETGLFDSLPITSLLRLWKNVKNYLR